jgi:hypothetical protein
VIRVERSDYSIEMHYFLRVIESQAITGEEMFGNPDCKGTTWTISSTFPSPPYSSDGSVIASYQLSNVNVRLQIANLTSGAVGQTVGQAITLGGGHEWFIDSMLESNEKILPTANPTEWVAKAEKRE